VQTFIQITLVITLELEPWAAAATGAVRDTRTWHNPEDASMAFTFSTLESYEACPGSGASDEITATGIGEGWHLAGAIWLTYFDGENTIDVPNGRFPVDFTSAHPNSSFSFTVYYPSSESWLKRRDLIDEKTLHVDVAIEVTDEHRDSVQWIGGDLVNAPGTLGPGGQDWFITCFVKSSLFLPLLSSQ
jgi:hypothetical protein